MAVLRESDPWRDGMVTRPVHLIVWGACAASLAAAVIGPCEVVGLARGSWARVHHAWFEYAVMVAIAVGIVLACAPRGSTARVLRAVIALPVLHLAGIVIAWWLWSDLAPHLRTWYVSSAEDALSLLPVTCLVAVVVAVGGRLAAHLRRRPGEWAHASVTIALTYLLLLGLWLALVPAFVVQDGPSPHTRALIALLPPLGIALAVALAPQPWPRPLRRMAAVVIAILVVAGVYVRIHATFEACIMYANLVPALLAAAVVAIGALIALAATNRPRRMREDDAVVGTILDDAGGPIAVFEITGWLRGPRPVTRAFTLLTTHGALPVPPGIAVAAALPQSSTRLRVGEATAVVHPGDRVAVHGLVPVRGDGPFRTSEVLIPGPRGTTLAPLGADPASFAAIVLAAWRPCVAYLMIVLGVCLPALAGAIQP
jgi:hypothetical protein